ncbi:MAG TPA: hypothetical protein VFA45_07125 [Actinomycetes bacterium]|jgi:hypothetical protein|nr:hypothetical protein [Actinomycetes bacterium]
MKIRRRLGVLATAVSGLLAAGLLLSAPAFAWTTQIEELHAICPPGSDQNQVEFVLKLFDDKHKGKVEADYAIEDETTRLPTRSFDRGEQFLEFEFSVPGPDNDHTVIRVHTKTFFKDSEETPESRAWTKLEKCKKEETTTTTTIPTPTSTTEIVQPAPTTAAPSTAAARAQLPFTGSNSLPILIAALVMVVGGLAALLATRVRGRHAK